MHNIPFIIVPAPDYILAIGENMEREYNVPIHEIEEVKLESHQEYTINNNNIDEIFEVKALVTNPEIQEKNEPVSQIPRIETTAYEGNARETNNENTTIIYPSSVSHHNILTKWNVHDIIEYEQPLEYQISIGTEETRI